MIDNAVDLWDFCAPIGACMYPELEKPFSRRAYSYATDGKILVRVPRRCEDGEASWPIIEKLTEKLHNDGLSPLPVLTVPQPERCPRCRGYGKVRPCSCVNACKRCDGWGEVPAKKEHPDQSVCNKCDGRRTIWPDNIHVYLTPKLAIAPVYYLMLSHLPNIRVDLNVSSVAQSWSDRQAITGISFSFDGGDGLLMPICLHREATP